MARSEGAEGPAQHLAAAIAAAFARAEQPGEHLAVHAPKLAVKPRLQILRRHRRSLLLRLEHPHRPAVEDHVNRASRLGLHRSIILRIGISAAAACAEDWISRMPALCSVAAVVMMIAMAMMLENAIPTSVSIRMRRNSPSCP